mmetsp:Transcript_12959/g.27930  ORF Transcript_12959/g.27930 Transcript_12959/m.27930 type:complete len:221 (-) Transcript_12959:211-873(-)
MSPAFKLDFNLLGLEHANQHSFDYIKAGDVVELRQGEVPASDAGAAPSTLLLCYSTDHMQCSPTSKPDSRRGHLLGAVPADVARMVFAISPSELVAKVRTIKKDAASKEVKQVQIRVEQQAASSVKASSSIQQESGSGQAAAEEGVDQSGYTLNRSQLEALARCEEVRLKLMDERLQQLLAKIDSAKDRELALDMAMTADPGLHEFAEQVLALLDGGAGR